MRLISVVMGCTSVKNRTKDTLSQLNYGFSNYELIKIFSKGEIIKTISKVKVNPNDLNIIITEDLYYLKRKNQEFAKIKYDIELNEYKINHYEKEDIGKIKITIGENEIVSSLNIGSTVTKNNFIKLLIEIIKNIF